MSYDIEDADCGAHKVNIIVRRGCFLNLNKKAKPSATPDAAQPEEEDEEDDGHRAEEKAAQQPAEKLVVRCRKLVSHFRYSQLGWCKLMQIQDDLKLPIHRLVQVKFVY